MTERKGERMAAGHPLLILDGAMGTMIQRYGLEEEDYRCGVFGSCRKDLKGNNECLNLTRPEIIRKIHEEYIDAGADIIESNTFSANPISQKEYDCEEFAEQMAFHGARIAREAADDAMRKAAEKGIDRKVWVAGSIGPTSKSLSLSTDAGDPSIRPYSFDDMFQAYRLQAEAVIRAGADLILIETCFDALNVKAALSAVDNITSERGGIPVIISVSVGDRSGRTLTGQTLEAFYASVCHYPLLAFGLNCSLGADGLRPLMEDMDRWCRCRTICYPNAGLPDEMGRYSQSPSEMAAGMKAMAEKGLLDIAGGCCGTTPEHIKAIAEALKDIPSRGSRRSEEASGPAHLKVSGLESVTIDKDRNNFINIGERTNVAGSRKFARLISEGDYETALQIAARQIEDGAHIIDINMDDAMIDSTREMERFLRYISNDPSVAKAALMIDSSHWETLIAGLKNAQGKCIVNSISLKEGEDDFIEKARIIGSYGAAMVVMAFDEQGQATTFDRKIQICERAYRLLTSKAGISPENIIFDVNILSIGTGIEEHARYAVDFIDAVKWIKANLPGALTSGGVSNLSFAFRGNNIVREAMHSAFLYHAVKAGLDMAIVNPSMLQIYDDIEPELLKCVEDVIFDNDPLATERLTDKASRILAATAAPSPGNVVPGEAKNLPTGSVSSRLRDALVKGAGENLECDIQEALNEYGTAVAIIEGPLMEGMETVGKMFGEGKMFLPQVVKSAKIMREAVKLLEPYMNQADKPQTHDDSRRRSIVVLATVKGDVHDIGKNITGIVLTCNGFEVHDLGVMVDRDTIISEALRLNADIIAVSGLITPSLYQMEELCRAMAEKGMDTPLFVGGATTSALHTAVKLAPLYAHVYHGADASAAAVMAKKYLMDPAGFEAAQHEMQERLASLYRAGKENASKAPEGHRLLKGSHVTEMPEDIPVMEIPPEEVMPYFDWKMFYAIWGVRYGGPVPEALELIQLKRDAEDELALKDFRITVSARFLKATSSGDAVITDEGIFPMLRQEGKEGLSLCDFIIPDGSGSSSPFGIFAVSVHKKSKAHVQGCCCPACSDYYEDMIGRTVRMTLAEAASCWIDARIRHPEGTKLIKPAAGYASCPDHTLKGEILDMLAKGTDNASGLGISLTESYAMTPESSICGMIFIHPDASYPEIRSISRRQFDEYASRRGMDEATASRFLGHLLK